MKVDEQDTNGTSNVTPDNDEQGGKGKVARLPRACLISIMSPSAPALGLIILSTNRFVMNSNQNSKIQIQK
jgi:hypothetical protein